MVTQRTRPPADVVYAPPPSPTPDVRPLTAAERLPLVDVLRGVAILGVLVAYTMWNLGAPPAETWSRADRIVDVVAATLVDSKFLTIFAFLFGVGTSQQWRRIEERGRDPVAIHLRRMAFLLSVGLLHAVLLRNGDILAPYAILGTALLVVRHQPARRIVVAAAVLAVLPYVVRAALAATGVQLAGRPVAPTGERPWYGYWAENLAWLRYWYLSSPLLDWARILALMLAGVAADRARILPRLAAERGLALRTLAVALPIAIASRAAFPIIAARWPYQPAAIARGMVLSQTYFLSAWSLAAVYMAAFALLCQRPGWPERLGWLRAVGRMAFTNYLVQALLVVPLCLALALFDTVTPTRGLLLAVGVAALQIPFSVWWLRRHPYGPVEGVWRAVTYGTTVRQPAPAPSRSSTA